MSSVSDLTLRTEAWRHGGGMVELDGRQIFARERPGGGPAVLFLHGFPSSSYDWRHMYELLAQRRIVSLDFLGFGLSEKPRDQVYSLLDQADIVETLVEHRVRAPVVIVGHDMGTSVATELLARDLEGRLGFELAAVLLLNGSIVIERATLTISQKLLRGPLGPLVARLSNERTFRAQFARIFSEQHPLSGEEAADQWSLLAYNDGQRILDRLVFYMRERVTHAERWHGALRDWPGRLELAWAGLDPVCTESVLEAVIALRPSSPLTRLPQLGHYPQIEDPAAIAAIVDRIAAES